MDLLRALSACPVFALFFRHRSREVGVGCVGGAVSEERRAREGVEHDESDVGSNRRLCVLVDGV